MESKTIRGPDFVVGTNYQFTPMGRDGKYRGKIIGAARTR